MSEPTKEINVNQSAAGQTASLGPVDATRDFTPTAAAPERSSASNVQVPGYRMLGVLGRGGMGVVYKAIQEKANRPVALKMILAGSHADQSDRLRFKAEAEAAARLSHPNIVQLYEVGETPEGFPFFSLEYVAGGTLAERLKQSPLRAHEAAALVESLARAMHYAHEHGIIHRDLKPLNILLQTDDHRLPTDDRSRSTLKPGSATMRRGEPSLEGQSAICNLQSAIPKISDFGLAKQLDAEDGLTRTGAIMGSPAYMAPEQAFGHSKDVGPAADIYALGAILYECLTGRPPFKGATVADTLEQVRTMEPITLKAFAKEIPRDLETICLHCLHKDPQRRYASAEALADDLRRYVEGKPITVRPVGTMERVVRWCRRNPRAAFAVATIAGLLLAITVGSAYSAAAMATLNNKIVEESKETEKQRKEAVEARDEANKKKKEAEEARDDAKQKKLLAEARGEQALKAVGLFATDARGYCEDALVPGESRSRLYEVLIRQLEQQADQAAGEATIDGLRNKAFLYQTLCAVTHDFQSGKSTHWFNKGIQTVDQWEKLRPNDPAPLGFRAAFLNLRGNTLKRHDKLAEARLLYHESEAIRRKLVGNPDVDTAKKIDAIAALADSLDSLEQFEESIALRRQVVEVFAPEEKQATDKRQFEEARQKSFPYREALCRSYQQGGLHATDYAKRKAYLSEANKLSVALHHDRPANRSVLMHWAINEKMFGELEWNYGILAEKAGKLEQAAEFFSAAGVHYHQLPGISRKLATSDLLVDGSRDYARSFYTRGLAMKKENRLKEAGEDFKTSLAIREQTMHDHKDHASSSHLQIDLYFSRIALGDLKAIKDIEDTGITLSMEPDAAYRLACLHSLAIQTIAEIRHPKPLTEGDTRLRNECLEKAIKNLRTAHDAGFTDFFQSTIDADLDAIRHDRRMKEFEATHLYQQGVLAKKHGDPKKAQTFFEKSKAAAEQWIDVFKSRDERFGQVKSTWLCAHVRLGNSAEATESAGKARRDLGGNQAAAFQLARVYALASDDPAADPKSKAQWRTDALDLLEQTTTKFATEARLTAEVDFDPIRSDPRFVEILERAKKLAPR